MFVKGFMNEGCTAQSVEFNEVSVHAHEGGCRECRREKHEERS